MYHPNICLYNSIMYSVHNVTTTTYTIIMPVTTTQNQKIQSTTLGLLNSFQIRQSCQALFVSSQIFTTCLRFGRRMAVTSAHELYSSQLQTNCCCCCLLGIQKPKQNTSLSLSALFFGKRSILDNGIILHPPSPLFKVMLHSNLSLVKMLTQMSEG